MAIGPRLAGLSRAELHAHAQHYFKQGGATEPEVAVVEYAGERAILKDYGRTPGWFGRLIAPVLIWREASALERLAGLTGVPRLYRRLDSRALLMEYLPGTPWPQARPADASYARLADLIAGMHARGVAHCDLRAPSNILVDETGQPYVVDFVARVRRGRTWNAPWNWLFAQFCGADDGAVLKLKTRFAKHLISDAERAAVEHRGPLERLARRLGTDVRRITRYFVRSG